MKDVLVSGPLTSRGSIGVLFANAIGQVFPFLGIVFLQTNFSEVEKSVLPIGLRLIQDRTLATSRALASIVELKAWFLIATKPFSEGSWKLFLLRVKE